MTGLLKIVLLIESCLLTLQGFSSPCLRLRMRSGFPKEGAASSTASGAGIPVTCGLPYISWSEVTLTFFAVKGEAAAYLNIFLQTAAHIID